MVFLEGHLLRALIYFILVISFTSLSLSAAQIIEDTEKKTTYYIFGDDTEWELKSTESGSVNDWAGANKTGSINNYKHTYYYRLNISQNQLNLKLTVKDDGSNDEHVFEADTLDILNVTVDGKQLSLFKWCLDNQQESSDRLSQSSEVKDAVCTNIGNKGEFSIRINNKIKRLLIKAKNIEIATSINNEKRNLVYSLSGFSEVMYQVDSRLAPAPVVKKIAKVKNKVNRNKEVKKTDNICFIRPADAYKLSISAVPYPCDNEIKKAMAQGYVSAHVEQEKQKRKKISAAAAIKKEKLLAAERKENARKAKELKEMESELKKVKSQKAVIQERDIEWDIGQSVMWIGRCKKRWEKGFSPCFCRKYISQAPIGVKDTCDK